MPRTILLADDSVTIRKVVELTFLDSGFRVVAVGTGREALDLLGELRPDVVLADVVMPGPSGYEVCRAVKSSPHPVPVLLLAGTFEPFDADEARACGADGHLTKPFDSRTLVTRVDALLESGFVAAPEESGPARGDEEIEAIFDDLAAPPAPEIADLPESPAAPPSPPEIAPVPSEEVEPDPVPARVSPPSSDPAPPVPGLSAADIDAIASAVVARLSERVLREIAWDVVPDLAEVIVRERLAELEREP